MTLACKWSCKSRRVCTSILSFRGTPHFFIFFSFLFKTQSGFSAPRASRFSSVANFYFRRDDDRHTTRIAFGHTCIHISAHVARRHASTFTFEKDIGRIVERAITRNENSCASAAADLTALRISARKYVGGIALTTLTCLSSPAEIRLHSEEI